MYRILLIIFFVFTACFFAQIKGTSQVGSLRLKKDKSDKLPFVINLFEPDIRNGEEITVDNKNLIIRGRVENRTEVRSVKINNQPVTLTEDNTFYREAVLKPGINNFLITATDNSNKSISYAFNIRCTPEDESLLITIIEPVLNDNNEITVKEKNLVIKAQVDDKAGITEVRINNQKANPIGRSEYYINLKLKDGFNTIIIKAVDKTGKTAQSSFRIKVDADRMGPEVTIYEPSVSRGISIIKKSETLMVKGKAEDKSGVYEVKVNDIKAKLEPDGTFSLQTYLQMGDNRIIVKALDNNLNETVETFHITRKLEDLLVSGRFFAMCIGIDSYSGYWPALKSATNDAREMASILNAKYKFDSVITVLDGQATRKNIIQRLEWLANNLSKDDNLLIFYAGHGQFNKALNRGYWVPSDASSNSIADYIPNSEIRSFLAGIPAKHILLITDACFGGDIFRGKTESYPFNPNDMEKYYREVYRRQSRLALTSGGVEEVRDDGKDGHSIFTYYLLKALNENKNRYMDAAQLYNELRIAVANNSDQTPILQAVKDTYDEGGQFIFVKKSGE